MRAAAFLLLAVTLPCGAAVTVRITGADEAANVSVTAVNGADPSQKVTATPAGGEARLDLVAQQVWYVRAYARGFWNGEQAVYVTGGDQSVEAVLRPAGNLTAALQHLPQDARRVHVRFTAAGGGEPRGDMTCAIREARFTCPLPAGRLDLSVGVRGTAYAYRWDVEVTPAAGADLGTIALVGGGSIVGTVDASRIRSGPASQEVVLRRGHGDAEVARTRPRANGFFQFTGVEPGEYVLALAPRKGAATVRRDVLAQGAAEARLAQPLSADVARRLAGTVAPPVHTDVHAWRRYGMPRIEMQARSGFFRGVLPAGKSSWDVTVAGDAPQLERTLTGVRPVSRDGGVAYVDLQLAGGAIEGSVVEDDGTPVKKAIVTVEKPDGELVSQTDTGEDGTFRVGGVEDAVYRISAQTAGGESERTEVTVEEGRGGPARIVVRKVQWLRGTIRSRRGAVPGAVITAFSEEDPSYGAAAVETDPAGRFAARLPQGTRGAQVFVAAPGHGCTMQHVAVDGKPVSLFVGDTATELTLRYRTGAAVELHAAGSSIHPEFWLRDCPGVVKEGSETTTLRLPRLAPGEYSLCEKGSRCVSGVLVPGGSAALDLTAR